MLLLLLRNSLSWGSSSSDGITNAGPVIDVRLHGDVGLQDGAWSRCLPVHYRLPLDQHATSGPPVGGYERLGQEIIHPLGGHVDCRGTDSPSSLLVQPLGTYVQHHLLHILRCQADQDAEEEVTFNLLLVLQ